MSNNQKKSRDNTSEDTFKTNIEDDTDKVSRIHDAIAQYWNWAYYDEAYQSEASWLLNEFIKSTKSDVEPRASAILAEIEEYLKEYKRSSLYIIDVGCGPGGFIRKMINYFSENHPQIKLEICGIDVSKEMLNYAKEHIPDLNVELLNDSITNPTLKLKKEPFDLAVMVFILPWYNDESALKILSAVHGKLKTNGTVILMDFSVGYSPWKGLNFFSKTMDKMADMMWAGVLGEQFHLYKRRPDELGALLEKAGFEMMTCYPTESKGRKKGMLVVRAKVKSPELSIEVAVVQEQNIAVSQR